MKDIDMEARLHDYYGTFTPDDSGRAVAGVGRVVADARGRAPWTLGAWLGHRRLRGAAVVAATAVLVLALAAPLWFGSITGPAASSSAASPTPSPSASASPSAPATMPSPVAVVPTATLGPAKCTTDAATTSYQAVGWRGTRVLTIANRFVGCSDVQQALLSVDPAVGQWRTEVQLTITVMAFNLSTDGSSIVGPSSNGILVVDAADRTHLINRPTSMGGDFGYYGLPVLPGGGYLVAGGDKLYRIASDGSGMTADRLPAGYVAVAPTSDPNLFILTRAEDAQQAFGLMGTDFRPYLWNLRTGALKQVASEATAVTLSPNSLAYMSVGSDWLSLAADGSTKSVSRPGAPVGWISPDGSRYICATPQTEASVAIEMRLASTDQILAHSDGVTGSVAWKGNVAAMVIGPGAGGGGTGSGLGEEQLVVIDGSNVKYTSLP